MLLLFVGAAVDVAFAVAVGCIMAAASSIGQDRTRLPCLGSARRERLPNWLVRERRPLVAAADGAARRRCPAHTGRPPACLSACKTLRSRPSQLAEAVRSCWLGQTSDYGGQQSQRTSSMNLGAATQTHSHPLAFLAGPTWRLAAKPGRKQGLAETSGSYLFPERHIASSSRKPLVGCEKPNRVGGALNGRPCAQTDAADVHANANNERWASHNSNHLMMMMA